MLKHFLLTSWLCTVIAIGQAQSLSQSSINALGSQQAAGGYLLSSSTGELAYQSFSQSGYLLSQGYQQPYLTNVGIDPLDESSLSVFPVPSTGSINISNIKGQRLSFSVWNSLGELIKKDVFPGGSTNAIELHLNHLNNGLYFLRVDNGHELESIPFIILK